MMERAVSLLMLVGSASYLWFALKLSFGSVYAPKAGFLPTVAGVLAVVLALILVVGRQPAGDADKSGGTNWRKFFFTLLGLAIYLMLLLNTGYIFATGIIMLYFLKVTDTEGWVGPSLIAAATALALYLLFEKVLAIMLP